MELVTIPKILEIYEKEIRKHTKNKRKIYGFDKYKMANIIEIKNTLENFPNNYFCLYNVFLIFEPKVRIVMALNVKDKIINHYITRHILLEKLEKYLDIRNVATRKNLGTDYARELIKKYLEKNKKYDHFYILKIDISKYFYTIDHQVLKSLLKEKLTPEEFRIISIIIDSTNYPYINERITKLEEKFHVDTTKYVPQKGLPIGNMTSQFLSIFYLYKLDHYIVHNLHITEYIRYMDDFILIHHDKKTLENALKEITYQLENIYHLKLNIKKTKIVNEKEGFIFLGYRYRLQNKKTLVTLTTPAKQRIRKRIKQVHYYYEKKYITFEQAYSSMQTFLHNYDYGSKWYVKRWVNKGWFDEFNKSV